MMEEQDVEVLMAFGMKSEAFVPLVARRITEWLPQEAKCGDTYHGEGVVTNNGWCRAEAERLWLGKGKPSAVVRRPVEGGGWLVAVATV